MPIRRLAALALCIAALPWSTGARAEDLSAERRAFDAASTNVGDVASTRVDTPLYRTRPTPTRKKDWRFFVAPYGWLASVNGPVVSGGASTDLDVPFSDILDATNGGFQLYTEIRWRKLFLAFDGTWAKLTPFADDVLAGLLRVEVDVEQRIFDVRIGYEIFRCTLDGPLPPSCEPWRRWMGADVFVGARYWYTKTTVSLAGQGPLGLARRIEGIEERWDPFVGVRFGMDLTRRWSVVVRGDIGGFGIGDAAELAWQVSGGLGYDLTSWMHFFVGWRALAFDTVTGSGTNRNGADLVQQGPLVGLGFSF